MYKRQNMFLRTTERILLKTGEFKAVTFDELFEKTKAIPWEEYIPKDGKFWVAKANSINTFQAFYDCFFHDGLNIRRPE